MVRIEKKNAAILAFLLYCGLFLHSQQRLLRLYQHFNNRNGLPQNDITSISRDNNKYIWIGTQNGLARYGGVRFIIFNKANTSLMTSNRLGSIMRRGKDIYCLTELAAKEILKINANSNGIEKVKVTQDNFYINNRSCFLDLGTVFTASQRKEDSTLTKDWKDQDIYAFLLYLGSTDTHGYLRHRKDVFYYENGISKKVATLKKPIYSSFVFNKNLYTIYEDKSIVKIDRNGNASPVLTGDLVAHAKKMESLDRTYDHFKFNGESVFFHSTDTLFQLLETAGNIVFRPLVANVGVPHINAVYYDQEFQFLFIGTSDEGLYIYRDLYFDSYSVSNDLLANFRNINAFYSCLPYKNNQILTPQGIFDRSGHFYRDNWKITGNRLFKTHSGKYVFSIGPYLYVADDVVNPGSPLDSLPEWVFGIDETIDGVLYCALKQRILAYDGNRRSVLLTLPDRNEIISVIKLIEDRELWISTRKNLYRYNIKNKTLSRIKEFVGKDVRVIYQDQKRNIWLGTYGDGWFRYSDQGIVSMPVDKKGYLKILNGLIEDDNGYMWFSTNNGLFRFYASDVQNYQAGAPNPFYNFFDSDYGFLTDEFNGGGQPNSARLSDGRLIFPSLKGIVCFDPQKVQLEESTAPFRIDHCEVDGTKMPYDSVWKIRAGFDQAIFSISAPFFGNTYNAQVEYGFNSPNMMWIPLESDGIIRLTRLAAGDYTIVLRRPKGFNNAGFVEKKIRLIVLPMWYQSRWFSAILLLMALFIVYFLFRFRIDSLRRQKERLDVEVKVNTKEIETRNVELQNKIIEILRNREELKTSNLLNERLMGSLAHDIRSPLRFQLKAIEILTAFLKDSNNPDIVRITEEIQQNTGGMYHFTGDILTWHLSMNEGKSPEKEVTDLRELVEKCISFLRFSIRMNNNTFVNNIQAGIDIFVARPILEIVVRNILDNSNKNTRNGMVYISVKMDENGTCGLTITDNGDGMRPEETMNFNKFYKFEKESSMPGFGTYMLRDFIHYLGAEITYRSAEGIGTSVTLKGLEVQGHTADVNS